MKKRFCSQYLFCSPCEILKQTVIEQDEKSRTITDLFPLNGRNSESAHTLFVDGIISAEILSAKANATPAEINMIQEKYNYIDLSTSSPLIMPEEKGKDLLIDFGTNAVSEINKIISQNIVFFSRYSIFEIIASCVYFPATALNKSAKLALGRNTNLIQWRGVDLVNKKITEKTRIFSL
ncbi:hypothetical protein D0T49_03260 [Paludibacter sp. 221]|uniref:hypothetical protein n=1 Tax=Paludibacter sp. 221 TaxID=2302939 RepID=UPI0013D847AB|nr:hypothetical protein [Paludibacter sp. 221]NDV46059.1 hypothetical protein [Paludibacter sp. 221]